MKRHEFARALEYGELTAEQRELLVDVVGDIGSLLEDRRPDDTGWNAACFGVIARRYEALAATFTASASREGVPR